jgi:hypothetical protein
MPDTLSLADAIEQSLDRLIEEYGDGYLGEITRPHLAEWVAGAVLDRERAHLDALTEAVRALRVKNTDPANVGWNGAIAAVLAILNGEPADPDAEAEAEFLKPIKPQGI